jgi:hypothetical protein
MKMAKEESFPQKVKKATRSRGQRESLLKAQKIHVILLNIGKKHRNEEVNKNPLLKKGYYPSGYKPKKK